MLCFVPLFHQTIPRTIVCVFGDAASVKDDVGVKAGHMKVIVNLAPVESQMEVAPAHPIDIVESVVNEKQTQEVSPIEAAGNNHTEVNNVVKTHEPEVLQAPVEENRSADAVVAPISSREGDAVVLEPPLSSRVSESAEVVTPAGTVEVETPHCSSDTPTEATEKVVVVPTLEPVEGEIPVNTVESKAVEDLTIDKTQSVEQHEATSESSTAFTEEKLENTPPVAAEPAPTHSVSASSPSKKAKSDKKHTISDSFASDEVLSEVQKFLTLQIVENRCSSHTKEINEFVETHLNEKQRKRYVAALVERVVQNITEEAAAKGEEVSIEVQSNICLIEQMFLTLGRRSPLQDMYTAEEEEMLDLLFHSNSSDNLPING